jgi:hypothetical protein
MRKLFDRSHHCTQQLKAFPYRGKDERESSDGPVEDHFGAAVWEETEKNGPEKTWKCAEDADRPLGTVNLCGLEGTTTDEDDEDLAPDHNAIDADKEPIPETCILYFS